VYACAKHAGSTVVCLTTKRANVVGPLARIPGIAVLTLVRNFIVPPASATVPERAYFLALPPVAVPTDMVLALGLRRGTASGWIDVSPWPTYDAAGNWGQAARVIAKTDDTHFQVQTETASLPGGVVSLSGDSAPSLMAWNQATSRWTSLNVLSVTESSGEIYDVVLDAAPVPAVAVGDHVSPDMGRRALAAEAVESYFDSLGTGEIVATDDIRRTRAGRFPETEERPFSAGQDVVTYVTDTVGSVSGAILSAVSPTDPPIPSDPALGAGLLTLGQLSVYPL
jgi:hypothetical protein